MTYAQERLKLLGAQEKLPFANSESQINFCKDRAKSQKAISYNFITHKDFVLITNTVMQTGRELKSEHPKLTRGIH